MFSLSTRFFPFISTQAVSIRVNGRTDGRAINRPNHPTDRPTTPNQSTTNESKETYTGERTDSGYAIHRGKRTGGQE